MLLAQTELEGDEEMLLHRLCGSGRGSLGTALTTEARDVPLPAQYRAVKWGRHVGATQQPWPVEVASSRLSTKFRPRAQLIQ